ncbi:transposase [Bradyrhizobium sp. 143]|nr:transposase [Bradyrhizobium sp. 143]MCK1725548.1 transposase [Bradyrhizobium sp. 142]
MGAVIRRFLIHVLPRGFHRIRHYGLLASGIRADNIARARELLAVSNSQAEPTGAAVDAGKPTCPCCGGRMIIIEVFARGNTTASANSSTHRNQGRHLMTASHLRKSDRRTSCLSTGHGRARSDTQPSAQTVRQFTAIDATRRSSSSRFTVHRLAGAPRLHSHTSSAALKSP